MGRLAPSWGRLSLRWKLVVLNGLVVLLAGAAVVMLTHRVAEPYFVTVMHDAQSGGQAAYDSAVDHQVVPAVALATGVALALNFAVITVALRPLRAVRATTRRLAAGDVTARVDSRRQDEIGEVARSVDDMAAELGRLEDLRRRATDDVAHELRTPLHNLLGLIEAMRDGVMPADGEQLDRVHREILRLAHLVDDLHRLADAQAARDHLRLRPVRVASLAREVVRSFDAQLAGRGLGARVVTPGDEDSVVAADPDRLSQVLGNLLANAARYATPGTDIEIEVTRPEGRRVRVAVGDQGQEIPAEVVPYIFERFVRADPSRGRDSGGAGIGLAVVRELVEAHGGAVGAGSGGGRVTVWFELPLDLAFNRQFMPSSAETTKVRGLGAVGH